MFGVVTHTLSNRRKSYWEKTTRRTLYTYLRWDDIVRNDVKALEDVSD